jgi:4-amino-4-deoxychorismate lyase
VESPFRGPLPADLTLIETFGRRDGAFVGLADHLARLERTAAALGVPCDRAAIDRALAAVAGDGPLRVRLTVALDGEVAVAAGPLAAAPAGWTVRIAGERLDPDDPWLRVKTSVRGRYDRARAALPPGVDEWLFLNTRGEVCEGTITNVFVASEGVLLTPPLASGLLPGVLRGQVLREGRAREAVLYPADLAAGLFVGNALRGLIPARLAPQQS